MKKRQLTHFVHRALIVRLAIAGLVFSFAAAALTYYLRGDEISDGVLAQVTRHIDIFQQQALLLARERGLDSSRAMREALAAWAPGQQTDTDGSFVAARVIDQQGKTLFQYSDRAFAASSVASMRLLNGAAPRRVREDLRYQMVPVDGHVLVYAQVPLHDAGGETIAQVRSLYVLSESARATLRRDILGSVLFVVGMIVLTTLLLYPVILMLIRHLGRLAEHLLHSNLEMLQVIGSAIAKRDSDTDAHNYRVSLYSLHLAMALGLPRHDLRRLLKGAFLHDVGKIGIPDRILHKPGKLEAAEIAVMRQHVPFGLDIIERSHWLTDAAEVVGGHHERFDGSGYPLGLRGENIPLLARIFAIADVFDALCSVRPYKQALSLEAALAVMREASGSHFDDGLFTRFESMAESLHARYGGRDDPGLREELKEILHAVYADKPSRLAVPLKAEKATQRN